MTAEQTRSIFERARTGDDDAAQAIVDRYLQRLIGLARARLSDRLAQKVDPDDVVQSAFRSFFVQAKTGRCAIERAGDLWSLLAAITRNKLLKKVEHYRQGKRSLDREQSLDGDPDLAQQKLLAVGEPTVDEAVALSDELEFLMRELTPIQRLMLELRLQGQPIPDVAKAIDRSERTVRRFLKSFRTQLENRLAESQ